MRIEKRDQCHELAGKEITHTVAFIIFIQSIDNDENIREIFSYDLLQTFRYFPYVWSRVFVLVVVVEGLDTPRDIMEVEELPKEAPNYVDRSLMLTFVIAKDVGKADTLLRKTALELADDK